MLRNRKLQILGAFLLGFTVWIPFAMLALDLCPYRLVIIGVGDEWWGWERKPEEVYPDHIPDGCYQGFIALVMFYTLYTLIVVFVYLVAKDIVRAPKEK